MRTTLLLFILTCIACSKKSEINYLDQVPPGKTAQLFAPGIVSTERMEHSAPAFSPDGKIVLWTVIPDRFSGPAYSLEMVYENNKWSSPHRPSFNDSTADDYYPSFSPDGSKLFFGSRRKVPSGYQQAGDMRIWEVERKENAWGTPVPMDTSVSRGREYAHSSSSDGSIYFSVRSNGRTNWSYYTSSKKGGKYQRPSILPYSINSMGYEDGPYIAPDESYLIFESDRPEGLGGADLYISFREGQRWSRPINMGPAINSEFSERFAKVSPDGKYLFFGSARKSKGRSGFDIYWIDASIIEELKKSKAASEFIDNGLGEKILTALDAGDWFSAEKLLQQWMASYPDDRDAIFNYAIVLKSQKKFSEAKQFLTQHEALFTGNKIFTIEMAVLAIGLNDEPTANQLLAPLLQDKDQLWNRYQSISNSLFDMGQYDVSDAYLKKMMSVSMWAFGYYKRGAAYATIGERDRAYQNLSLAVANGFNNREQFESDDDLAPLRSDKRWSNLLSR